jgi:hypothetical protein
MMMRRLMWFVTIALTFSALSVWTEAKFVGVTTVAGALAAFAILACPLLWARPDGIVPELLVVPGKTRFTLAATLILASPLLLPWQLWI